ncbi:hypothetical protein QE152_g11355 [Popillia japonica]|uniref:Uncharacterized protein n=1 Tax=Popillia japonica TaxID=7064 RepID=A0AAW1LSP7_POPJA
MIGISRSSNANLATYAGKWIGMDTLETVSTTTIKCQFGNLCGKMDWNGYARNSIHHHHYDWLSHYDGRSNHSPVVAICPKSGTFVPALGGVDTGGCKCYFCRLPGNEDEQRGIVKPADRC